MDRWMQSMLHFGNLLRREAPPITPTLDDFDILQFLRPAYERERSEDFKILLNVSLLEKEELIVEIVDGKILEIKATHGRKLNKDGFWMSRDLKYTFEIPEKSQGKELKATWSEDEFLLIEQAEKSIEAGGDRIRLLPEPVEYNARQVVELRTVRDLVQDIRDKAADALRYITTHMSDSAMTDANGVFRATAKRLQKESKAGEEKMECDDNSGADEAVMDSVKKATTRVLLIITLCATLYGVLGPDILPGNEIFAITALGVSAYIGGWITGCFRLPPLIGMLAVGLLMRNLPFITFSKDISTKRASTLRNTALSVILLKAGLGLDAEKLKALGPSVAGLSIMPCLAETSASAIASHLFLGLPWLWSCMLGFILSAVSAAVLVPGAIRLSESGRGFQSGIPTLLMASVSLDNVIALIGFVVTLNILTSSHDSLMITLLRRLLEPVLGMIVGIAYGIFLWYFPDSNVKSELPYLTVLRSSLLCLGGLAFTFVSTRIGISGAGALACVTLAFCASLRWSRDPSEFVTLKLTTGIFWDLLEPLLFGLIGCEVTLYSLKNNIGYGTLVLFCGISIRMVATVFALLGSGLNLKEKVFVSVSWISKATVQAAVGSQALDYGRIHNKGSEFEEFGNQVLTVSVLAIILTAPIGAAFMDLLGPRLLKRETSEVNNVVQNVLKPGVSTYGTCTQLDQP